MRIGIDCRKIHDFGIGTYIRGLTRGLAALEGAEQYVAFVPPDAAGLLPEQFERVVVPTPNYTIRELFTLAAAIREARIDLFHSPHYVIPFTSCPSVATLHDTILFSFPPANPVGAAYVRFMTRRAARRAAALITVTQAAKDEVVRWLKSDPAKISVIHNGIDELFFDHGGDAAGGEYFLYVGNDKPHKNVERLVAAFGRLRAVDPSLELVLAGAEFPRFAGSEGVRCEGFVPVERLRSLYRGALALVMPSLEEGFGLPALEAMAAGTPVVTSNAPALLEITGEAALHADALSVEALTAAMSRLAAEPSLRAALQRQGPERARRFSWSTCASATREVYRAVAASASR